MWNQDQDADFHALVNARTQAAGPTRRGALQAAVGLGYAAATLPTLAQTAIQTSTQGLIAGRVTIDSQGFALPAYRAAPAGQHNLPVVLVLSEIFGVHAYIADVCHRLAQAGYLAIAPELFVRQGDAARYTDIPRLMSEVIAKVPDAQVMADLDAAFNWAGGNGGHLRRAGVTGFCWGGRQAWLYNAHNPLIRASVAWYGRLEGATNALTPKQPLEVVNDLHGPVLGLYGGADTGIPQASVDRMQAALATGGPAARRSQFVVYPDAPHAFHADYRPSYRAQTAQDGWTRCLDWFKRNGVA